MYIVLYFISYYTVAEFLMYERGGREDEDIIIIYKTNRRLTRISFCLQIFVRNTRAIIVSVELLYRVRRRFDDLRQ